MVSYSSTSPSQSVSLTSDLGAGQLNGVHTYVVVVAGKIDLVKSKIGLGFTAFITVVASLTMSLGICTFFGLSISLSGR